MTDAPRIALIGTLDTKGDEIAYVRERLAALGAAAVVIDSGILGEPGTEADVSREQVAREAATTSSGSGQPGAAARRWS